MDKKGIDKKFHQIIDQLDKSPALIWNLLHSFGMLNPLMNNIETSMKNSLTSLLKSDIKITKNSESRSPHRPLSFHKKVSIRQEFNKKKHFATFGNPLCSWWHI